MKKSGKKDGCNMFAWLAVVFGALWLFSASISVVPELQAANSRFCALMLVLFLASVTLLVFARIARARDKRKERDTHED